MFFNETRTKRTHETGIYLRNRKELWTLNPRLPTLAAAAFSHYPPFRATLFWLSCKKWELYPTTSPTEDLCFSFSGFKIVSNFSQVIKYHNLLWKTDWGMWLISQGREPGPWEALQLLALGMHHTAAWACCGQEEGSGWADAEHIYHGLNKSAFQALMEYFYLASLLYCACDIRIMEILRNPSCGSLL